MKWALASREAILTASLLNDQWKESLEEKLSELLKFTLSNLKYHQIEPWLPALSRLIHSLASNVISWRSIAEEQMALGRVDVGLRRFVPKGKLLVLALLELVEMPRRSRLINFIIAFTKLLYLVNFVRTGEYSTPLLHLLGIRFVYFPRASPGKVSASPLEQVFCIYTLCKSVLEVFECLQALKEYNLQGDVKVNENRVLNCGMCLGERREGVCTPCGHCFCWTCLLQWMRTSPECPMCRRKPLSINQCCPVINI